MLRIYHVTPHPLYSIPFGKDETCSGCDLDNYIAVNLFLERNFIKLKSSEYSGYTTRYIAVNINHIYLFIGLGSIYTLK